MLSRAVSCAAFGLALHAVTADAQDAWVRADAATVRLAPSRFPSLPPNVRHDLERRGCRIPQAVSVAGTLEPHNVVRGALTGPDQVDWAVLCSVHDSSQILIYHDRTAVATDSLARRADRDELQGLGVQRVGYARKIGVASAASIRRYAKEFNGPTPPSMLDHEGLDDGFLGKGSTIYYAFEHKWLRLQGTDSP